MNVPSIPHYGHYLIGRARRTSAVKSLHRAEKGACRRGENEHNYCCVSTDLQMQRLSEVLIKEGESFEAALKRFTRKVQQDGLLSEAKRRQHYEPPSVKRKRKADARARKARKARAKLAAQGL
jgi:small subunit ribosomal protein S21